MRISDWSSDVCSSDLLHGAEQHADREFDGLSAEWRASDEKLQADRHRRFLGDDLHGDGLVMQIDIANDRVQEASQVGLFAQDQTDRTEIGQGASFRETQTEIVDAGFVGGQFKQGIERVDGNLEVRSEENTSELQSLMRISYA